jgi:saccharopine dehydrogenase-like NADP-dependent oxidoreductase
MPKFLVLGTGFVAEPLLEYLHRRTDNNITIVGITLEEAQELAAKFIGVQSRCADVSDKAQLLHLIKGFDVLISLVPAPLHPLIAEVCIMHKVNMLTASYQSAAMEKLSGAAQKAGICILNEMGLDPGIDHLSAMKIIDEVHQKGHEVTAFLSWCGGIPAPASNDNPLSYKFSWEPRGALLALLNDAVYLHNDEVINIAGEQLMQSSKAMEIAGLKLEGYANRESISYKKTYGIMTAQTVLRGTLRYQGFCEIMQAVKCLGLMSTDTFHTPENINWLDYLLQLNEGKDIQGLRKQMSQKAWQALYWLGCFSTEQKVAVANCSIDALCQLLLSKLSYKPGEQDMVVLQHKFVIKKPNGDCYFLTSFLKKLGDVKGYSAMAKTVGYPAAMAAQLIADKKIDGVGLLLPISKDIYQPILELLKLEGIEFMEEIWSDKIISEQEFIAI